MFKRCEICGAYLDPGERCDCDRTYETAKKKYESLIDTSHFQTRIRMNEKAGERYVHTR